MATLNPKLSIKLLLDASGVGKGVKQAKSFMAGLAKEAGTAEKHVNGLKKSLGGVWRITGGILLFNVIRHITHSIRDLIGTVLDFETQMYNVNSVAQLGAEEFKALQDQVLDLALDPRIKDGPAQLAAGLYEVVSAGYSTEDALKVMEQAALASTAGMTTSAVAADVLISTLGAYNLTADKSAEVTNELFQIVNISKYTFEDMAASLDSVTPTAAALGVSLAEVGAGMATMAAKGVDAETSTVQLNAILSALLKPTDAMTELIQGLGYESGSAMVKQEGLVKTMQLLYGVIGDNQDLAASAFGDVRALRGYLNLTNDGVIGLAKNYELMGHAQDGAGAMTKALNEQMKASSFQIAVLRKNIQILAILGFGLLAPYLNKALTGINTFVSGAIKGFRHFRGKGYSILEAMRAGLKTVLLDMFGPDTTKKVLKFFDQLVKYFNIVKGIISAVWGPIKSVLGFLVKHFDIIGPAILGAVVALKIFGATLALINIVMAITDALASPLVLVMIAIAAVGALVAVAWMKNWGDIQGKTKAAVDFIGKWLGKLWDFISPVIDGIVSLGKYWKDVLTHKIEPGNLEKVPGWIRPIAVITGRVVKSLRVFIKTWQDLGAVAAFKTIPGQIRAFGRAVSKLLAAAGFKNYAKAFKDVFNSLSHVVGSVIELIDDLVHGRWSEIWGDLKDIAVNMLKLWWAELQVVPAVLLDIFNMIPWGTIGTALWNGFKWILDFIVTTGIPWAFSVGLQLIQWLFDGMVWILTNVIIPWATAIPQLLVDLIIVGLDLLFQLGNDLIKWLSDGITFGWNWLIGWFKQIPDWLAQPFVNIYNSFKNIGNSIISGMSAGISEMWSTLTGWIDSILNQFNRIPSWLRPGSPSKTMTEYGVGAMAGLSLGINKGIPKVKKAVGNAMAVLQSGTGIAGGAPRAAGMSAATSATSGGVAGFGNINIEVNVNGSGDPQEVANRVGDAVVSRIFRAMDRMETVTP